MVVATDAYVETKLLRLVSQAFGSGQMDDVVR
jgi:hypothetical protein